MQEEIIEYFQNLRTRDAMVNRVGMAAIRNLDAIEIRALGLGQGKANTTGLLQSIDVLFALAAS